MKSTQDYKNAALLALKGNWSPSVLAAVIFIVVTGLFSETIILAIFVSGPLSFGICNAFKRLYRYSDTSNVLGNMFHEGFDKYFRMLGGFLLTTVFTLLWTLLLVIPGIIKYYAYSMTPYILADNPELGCNQAINRSIEMMRGHKMDLFIFDLSFIGWALLCILTFGIGFFWFYPYYYTARAAFYEDLKAEWESSHLFRASQNEQTTF